MKNVPIPAASNIQLMHPKTLQLAPVCRLEFGELAQTVPMITAVQHLESVVRISTRPVDDILSNLMTLTSSSTSTSKRPPVNDLAAPFLKL